MRWRRGDFGGIIGGRGRREKKLDDSGKLRLLLDAAAPHLDDAAKDRIVLETLELRDTVGAAVDGAGK